jgi:hypothetical protein
MKNLGAWALAGLLVISAATEMALAQSGGNSGGQSGASSGSASGQSGTQGTDHSGDARREGMTGSNSAVQSGGSTTERSGAAMPGHPTTTPPSSTATPGSGSVPGGDVLAEDTEAVRHAQTQLQTAGFSAGPANGIMDEQTRNAIRQFQQAKGLNVTGALDTETRAALQAGAGTQSPANQVR